MELEHAGLDELEALFKREDFTEVYAAADRVRAAHKGDVVQIRAICEFSNYCRRRCSYCGLNCGNAKVQRYRMSHAEIVTTAVEAWRAGYRTIVLQSGEDPHFTAQRLGAIVQDIKERTDMAVTLSCGELPHEDYAYLRACGADRYLLKHETADTGLYARLHPCGTLAQRVACLRDLKSLGYETGSGFMIGLPGQTPRTLAQDIALLRDIGCDMAGMGPFLPHPQTPLAGCPEGSGELTKRAVAIARLVLPDCNLPATTALGVQDSDAKSDVFSCGANVVMRKVTPDPYKQLYEIYPANLPSTDIRRDREELERQIARLGRTPL